MAIARETVTTFLRFMPFLLRLIITVLFRLGLAVVICVRDVKDLFEITEKFNFSWACGINFLVFPLLF